MTSSIPRQSDPVKYIPKGWGYEKWIANSEKYCGKLLFIVKGKQCSWHFHRKKDEVFYIQSGKIMLYYGWDDDIKLAENIILTKGDKFHVPVRLKHRMYALEDTELFEFSTEHFDNDSYRIIAGDLL
jgi:mannose-6-phosphate isomerase-like protein (cupin superfamily)